MFHDTIIEVQRDVEATLIPTGVKINLKKGTPVHVTQALGNSYTLHVSGNLVRVSGKDGDAIGLVILESPDINTQEGTVEEKAWLQLATCFDPEIPVNIVSLGLVYECQVTEIQDTNYQVEITMTLTAPGCGMGPVLVAEIQEKIKEIRGVADVKVDLVFDPPWDRNRMSDEAKLQLGLF
jgi:probable FeS assembly SUF system protein SufT